MSKVLSFDEMFQQELDEIVSRRQNVELGPSDDEVNSHVAKSKSPENDIEEARQKVRRQLVARDLVGVAFSGGGIRSASFNLGVLQALHESGTLRHVDYLSTVSGGGYIGSHLSSLVLHDDTKMSREEFPLASQTNGKQPQRVVNFIRSGQYLMKQPLVFARWYLFGLLLNNLVLFSGLIAVCSLIALFWRSFDMTFIHTLLDRCTLDWNADWNRPFVPPILVLLVAWFVFKGMAGWLFPNWKSPVPVKLSTVVISSFLIGIAVMLGNGDVSGVQWTADQLRGIWIPLLIFLAVLLLPIFQPWRLIRSARRGSAKLERLIFRVFSIALLAGIPLTLVLFLAREDFARSALHRTELTSAEIRDWRLLSMLPSPNEDGKTLLHSIDLPQDKKDALLKLMTTSETDGVKREPIRWSNVENVYGSTESADSLAKFRRRLTRGIQHHIIDNRNFAKVVAKEIGSPAFWQQVENEPQKWKQLAIDSTLESDFAAVQQLTRERKLELIKRRRDFLENGNEVTTRDIQLLNRLYLEAKYPYAVFNRKRILRVQVVAADQVHRLVWFLFALGVFVVSSLLMDPNATSIHGYYRAQLAKAYIEESPDHGRRIPLAEVNTVAKGAPYQLINGTLNMFEQRDGTAIPTRATFTCSKSFCGSRATHYCPTGEYLNGKLDLSNAMAISGGAISPNLLENPLMGVVMFILNLRLGQWLPNPRAKHALGRPWIWQLGLDFFFRDPKRRRFYFISDGGHHENLGVYELLRRKCRFILVSDAGQDEKHVFADFVNLYRQVRVQAPVEFFDLETGGNVQLNDLLLRPDPEAIRLGKKAEDCPLITKHHFIAMGIRYEDGSTGVLVYLKPSLNGDENIDLERYRAQHPEFPHQPTTDQMYDEDQFESYRQLGYHIGIEACGNDQRWWDVAGENRVQTLSKGIGRLEMQDSMAQESVSAHGEASDCDVPETFNSEFDSSSSEETIVADLKGIAELRDPDPELIDKVSLLLKMGLMTANIRAQAAWTLGAAELASPNVINALLVGLSDTSPEVRDECVRALPKVALQDDVRDAIKKCLSDSNPEVRKSANDVLGLTELGEP